MDSFSEIDPNAPPGGYGDGGGLIGAAIQTGGMLYDSAQNRKVARENTDKTIKANMAQADLSYQRAVQMWHEQNLYNSPAAQMARFKAAGLNPHLIYGRGNEGNASAPPTYHPPNLEYRYAAGNHGAAFASFLPTLMAVGSWIQNMRASEVSIRKQTSETLKLDQLIEYLKQMNPKLLEEKGNKLALFETQAQTQNLLKETARAKLYDLSTAFRQKYGEELWETSGLHGPRGKIGGIEKLKFLQEEAKTQLEQARASWSEFDITNPQQIMMMVMQGIMGMAGASLRMPGRAKGPGSQKAEPNNRPTGVRRIHPSRRVQRSGEKYDRSKFRD